jgi:hypothetical protein
MGIGGGGGENGDPGPCPTAQVPERYPPASCADPEWAEWPMPNDPMDVGRGAPNRDSFTNNGDGTITDNVTRLMWQATPTSDSYTRDEAIAYCATTLNSQAPALGGHVDWRLPTLVELTSIVDFGRPTPPAVDPTFTLVLMGSSLYWTATVWGPQPASFATVDFYDGRPNPVPPSGSGHVRCVR